MLGYCWSHAPMCIHISDKLCGSAARGFQGTSPVSVAAQNLRSDRVSFQPADVQDLPSDDESFDLVVCQFGVMFTPTTSGVDMPERRAHFGHLNATPIVGLTAY